MAKETLTSIAARLNVSVTTVSRVLNGTAARYRISDGTVRTVLDEVRRCNYSKNIVHRNARSSKRGGAICLLLPSVSNPFFADIASNVISEANKRGKITIVADSMESPEIQTKNLKTILSRGVEGIIAVPCGNDVSLLEAIDKAQIPVILLDRYIENTSLSYVTTNNHLGGLEGTNHLIRHGHKKITCIQGVPQSLPNIKRVQGYMDAMTSGKLEEYIDVVGNDFTVQNGYLATRLLLVQENHPTAIFALSNTIALGALKAIREFGLSIPEDISLLSFDNNLYLDYMFPPIARVGQPVEDMATLATMMLCDRIEGKKTSKQTTHLALSPVVIQGESVKTIKQ